MRKMILFIVVFFVVDRFMNYKLNHNSTKSRMMAGANSSTMSKHILLSEKKERTSDTNKKMLLAQNKKGSYLGKFSWLNKLLHSSNRNV